MDIQVSTRLKLVNAYQPVMVLAMMLAILLPCNSRFVQAATTTTTVDANIVSTISIAAQNGIVFGDVGANSIPGTITISVDGSRTSTGGATINTNTSGTPANFEVAGDPNALFMITLPDSIVITSSAGDTMTVDNFTSSPSANGQLDSSGRLKLTVGATMNVIGFQPFGAYTGTMSATVEYN
jgi:hypothetical protein